MKGLRYAFASLILCDRRHTDAFNPPNENVEW
jgi:hypothetical protein